MTLRVNGEIIPEEAIQHELDRLVRFYGDHMSAEEIKSQMDVLRKRAREQAVGTKLLMAEAANLDFHMPSEYVGERIEEMTAKAGGKENFAALLQQQGLTEEWVRRSIQQGRQVDLLVARVTESVADPTDAEMRAHFKQHAREYRKSDQVQARHILICPESDSEQDRKTARSRLQEIRRQIEEGVDFGEMASVHSDCPSGKRDGGSLGWFGRGMMVPEFDEAVFSMGVNELSDIIQTEFGFHLIQKQAELKGGDVRYEDVEDKIRDFLRHVRRGQALQAHVDELKTRAVIEDN